MAWDCNAIDIHWFTKRVWVTLDCLQSAFSLRIRPVLISASAIANHDVAVTFAKKNTRLLAVYFATSFVIYHHVTKVIFNLGSGTGVISAPSGEAAFVFGGMTFPSFRESTSLLFWSGTNSIFILKAILDLCKEKHAQRPCLPCETSSSKHVPWSEAITPPTPPPPPIRCRDLSEFFLNFVRKEKKYLVWG